MLLLCYCIGYTSNDWSTSVIPQSRYQEKLQERRREWEASQPVQPVDHQNERREIEQLRRTLQERERELQEERREKEKVRTRLQQQLQEKDRQITDKDQRLTETQRRLQSREREYQEREREYQEKEQQLQRQLQQEQQQGQERERQLQRSREREQNLQQQLQQSQRQLQEREQQFQERERQLQQSREREQNLQQQLQQSQQQLQERKQQFQSRERQFQERETRHQEETEFSWVVNREEITTTQVVLGKGGWGEVKVAHFRGLKVAAKCLHEVIISPYNMSAFSREMNIASKIRHPNLLQFIGATTEGNPIILTELMPTSLRKELESGGLAYPAILSISVDVACALNYLHLFKPHPILHRDVSSANVLLQPMGVGHGWRAKVSDYGSANLQPLARTNTPGNPVYSAPESPYPRRHSPAMDVFSYGVLLIEMMVCQFPEKEKRKDHIEAITRPALKDLIQRCLLENYRRRPTMADIIKELNESI